MEEKYLLEICNPKQWKTIPKSQLLENGKFLVYGANGIIGRYNEYNHEKPTVLITCRGATCGNIHITVPNAYINGNAMALDNLNEIICKKEYLYYFLQYYDMSKIISGTAQPQITITGLKKVKVKLYSIEKQEKIVNELNRINELIDLKKRQLEELSNFIKSQFVEMFGDLKDSIKLGKCCTINARIGWQSLTKKEHMKTGDYMLITGTDFKDNEIDYSNCVYVSKERYEMDKKIILDNDDILITKDGTIGKVAVVKNLEKPATLNSGIFVVRSNNIFNKEYIMYVFKGHIFKEFVNKAKTGATIKHLNQNKLINFEIPKPSMGEQIEFSNIYKQIDKQKFESMIQLDKENRIVLKNIIKDTLEKIIILYEFLLKKYFEEGK